MSTSWKDLFVKIFEKKFESIPDDPYKEMKVALIQYANLLDVAMQPDPLEEKKDLLNTIISLNPDDESSKKRLLCLKKKDKKQVKAFNESMRKAQCKIVKTCNVTFLDLVTYHLETQLEPICQLDKNTSTASVYLVSNIVYELNYFKRKIRQRMIENVAIKVKKDGSDKL